MRTIKAIALAIFVLPAAAMAASQADIHQVTPGGDEIATLIQTTVVTRPPATETLRGVVDSTDQATDTIKVRLSSDNTEQFKVQDGLMFDAVRFGDPVQISVQNISGARTIVRLLKE